MSKGVFQIGYKSYVLEAKDAVTLFEILSGAELYENKYRNASEGGSTHHIWEQTGEEGTQFSFGLLPSSVYRIAKLAGKPDKE